MSDKIDRVLDKLDKIQSDVTELKVGQAVQAEHISQNTSDLSDHIEGVKQNRARIEKLERLPLVLNTIKKWALWISAIAGVALVIHKLYKL